ncbi:hypothetical protein BOTBODRAFT_507582 [Botryobasidium botryosum FD-172 SS1]|uniref:Protein kinase domain-containing protein n=1 Tax=Botryobasidium botryosum (strain FD-172 SS1) TaxID=930990 RepID=A0A067M1Y7_BOTB1|nr:hypothetical protein BOTBODRAFT_507582 [Botryobasidium botryosum FD-172 SS1]
MGLVKELDMYTPLGGLLTFAFKDSCVVFDTHNRHYLEQYAPDLSISAPNFTKPHATSVCLTVDCKTVAPDTPLDCSANMGQALNYCMAVRDAQPTRPKIIAWLTNISENVFVQMEAHESGTTLSRTNVLTLQDAVAFVKSCVLNDEAHSPPNLHFSSALGAIEKPLGTSTDSYVAEFSIPNELSESIGKIIAADSSTRLPRNTQKFVVKRAWSGRASPSLAQEIELLTAIREKKHALDHNVPLLVYEGVDMEYGIVPAGVPFDPAVQPSSKVLRTVLLDVLHALKYLHTAFGFVHRDVRIANIITHDRRGILVDFDKATKFGDGRKVPYLGGCICVPKELIGNIRKSYVPDPSHDLLAFVLLVNACLSPRSLHGFLSENLENPRSRESQKLRDLWESLRETQPWRGYVEAAERVDYDGVEAACDLALFLW